MIIDFFYDFNSNFHLEAGQNPGEVSIDSNSLDKTLNFILNSISRTLAPLEAISNWKKSLNKVLNLKKTQKTVKLPKSRSVCYDFTKKMNLVGQFLIRKMIKRRMYENPVWSWLVATSI